MNRFFIRTFAGYVIIILLVFLLIYLFTQDTIKHDYLENLEGQLTRVGHTLKVKVSEMYDQGDQRGLDRMVKGVGREIGMRITIIAPDGTVVADSKNNPAQMENHADRPEFIRALKSGVEKATSTRFSTTMGEPMLYLALLVEKEGNPFLVIRLSLFFNEITRLIRQLRGQFALLLLLLFLVALVMAGYVSRRISRPVKDIAAAARQLAAGNFDVKIFLEKKDELAEVADSFNHMAEQQKNLFTRLSRNRAELTAIISTMKEGLLVLTQDGQISLCNQSFETIAGRDPEKNTVTGHFYWEILRIADFDTFVKTAFNDGGGFYQEIEINDNIYLVGFYRMQTDMQPGMQTGQQETNRDPQYKLVIIFHDITEFKRLEEIKKDFVVNLTHELKTPLTAIKGFIETLEEEEDIENTGYIDIIKRHTDRMNQIVSDMLVLSELEDNRRQVHFEPLHPAEILDSILTIYREKIKEKNLELRLNIAENLPPIMGEQFKIEQLFINLLDNAVKYAGKGHIFINMGQEKENIENIENIIIEVGNTGPPIPEKSLPRIFERFYVVDKSRSRRLGGTGLGLSIVKHVVLLHRGDISVRSTSKETVFTIKLPTA